MNVIQLGNIVESKGNFTNSQRGRIYSSEGLSPCLTTMGGGNLEPKIVTTLNDNDMEQEEKKYRYRIRKLTPRECFRLMDVSEEDIDKIQNAGISKSQQYHLAGNSIVVSCMYHIFRNLFTEQEQTTLF